MLCTWFVKNNSNFVIRYNTLNEQFRTIFRINSKSQILTYPTKIPWILIQKHPLSTSYYRLRQIDNDGKETLSKVISIQSKGSKGKLAVYPNPVSNTLTIETEANGDYQIFNLLGQTILKGKTTAQRIDVSALPEGSYVLKIGAEQAKFNKQ